MNQTITEAIERKPKLALVPHFFILLVVFLALLSMVALEQGRTIKSQRSLIHLLLKGHVERTGLGSELAASEAGTARADNQAQARELAPNPSPSIQVPAVKPPAAVKPGRKAKRAQEPFPGRPPAELSDPCDTRRVSFSI